MFFSETLNFACTSIITQLIINTMLSLIIWRKKIEEENGLIIIYIEEYRDISIDKKDLIN